MFDIKDVLTKIREVRKSKYYSQEYLATKLKISQNAYSKIELGGSSLTIERLFIIAVILDVDVLELLGIHVHFHELLQSKTEIYG